MSATRTRKVKTKKETKTSTKAGADKKDSKPASKKRRYPTSSSEDDCPLISRKQRRLSTSSEKERKEPQEATPRLRLTSEEGHHAATGQEPSPDGSISSEELDWNSHTLFEIEVGAEAYDPDFAQPSAGGLKGLDLDARIQGLKLTPEYEVNLGQAFQILDLWLQARGFPLGTKPKSAKDRSVLDKLVKGMDSDDHPSPSHVAGQAAYNALHSEFCQRMKDYKDALFRLQFHHAETLPELLTFALASLDTRGGSEADVNTFIEYRQKEELRDAVEYALQIFRGHRSVAKSRSTKARVSRDDEHSEHMIKEYHELVRAHHEFQVAAISVRSILGSVQRLLEGVGKSTYPRFKGRVAPRDWYHADECGHYLPASTKEYTIVDPNRWNVRLEDGTRIQYQREALDPKDVKRFHPPHVQVTLLIS